MPALGRPEPSGRKAVIYADIAGIEEDYRYARGWGETPDSKTAQDNRIGGGAETAWAGGGNIRLPEWLCALPGGKTLYRVFPPSMQGLFIYLGWQCGLPAGAVF